MKKWRCPKCGDVVYALAKEVARACPHNKNKVTNYEEVKDDD
jgi:hypothetical protein